MSVWATQRKLTYISILIAFLLVVVALPSYYFFYTPPTCFDQKQNQGELGVDCGGPCSVLCPALALDPIVYWTRYFQVSPGNYNLVAYVENPNLGSYAVNVPYDFKAYDLAGTLILEKKNVVNIWANKKFAIFESGINTSQAKIAQVTFEFTGKPVWKKNNLIFPDITVANPILSKESTVPRLNATIQNNSFTAVSNLPVIAVLYDAEGNAVGVSRTVVDFLQKGSPQNIFFIWPAPFTAPVAQKEIIPLISPIGQSN